MPRWLLVLAIVVGLTLLLALLRYAVDLLGVVFLIILVGFSIRTVSDWLTEGESVSIWPVTALSTGLLGTVMVGLWVFSSPEISGTSVIDRLPAPVVDGMRWLESKGWGQRVLLSRPGALDGATAATSVASRRLGSSVASTPGSSPSAGGSASPSDAPVGEAQNPSAPKRGAAASSRSAASGGKSTDGTGNNGRPRSRGANRSASAPTPAPAPVASQPSNSVSAPVAPTTTELRMWPMPAIVGKSVRLTALVRAESQASPSGTVTFYRNGNALGTVPVNALGPGRGEAALVTLSLPLGTHEISARYSGSTMFSSSDATPMSATVERK